MPSRFLGNRRQSQFSFFYPVQHSHVSLSLVFGMYRKPNITKKGQRFLITRRYENQQILPFVKPLLFVCSLKMLIKSPEHFKLL